MTAPVTSLPNHHLLYALADEQRLTQSLAALDNPNAGIVNVSAVLLSLTSTPVDPVRLQGICQRLVTVLHRYDAVTSTAPPAALNELVADSLGGCHNGDKGCTESVAAWDAYAPYCGTRCQAEGEARRP